MLFLSVLAVSLLVAWAAGRSASWRDRARWALAAGMAVAGVAHLATPLPFVQHLPTWVPARDLLVAVSGVAEIALGAALLSPSRWRPLAGWALAAYLVVVWPANVYVAVTGVEVSGQPGGVYPWLRLPLQLLFIAWAVLSTGAWTPRRAPATPDITDSAEIESAEVPCASAS